MPTKATIVNLLLPAEQACWRRGTSETVTIETDDSGTISLSLLSMLVNSNDALTALNGVDLSEPKVAESVIYHMRSYDAVTKANSETAVTIPGPAAMHWQTSVHTMSDETGVVNTPPQDKEKQFLVIEDEQDISELVSLHLQDLHARVTQVHTGPKGLAAALGQSWDAIILDLRLPGMDGIDVCRTIRNQGITTPIIMLTARTTELDRVLGLEIGADDYLTKPFSALELQARVKALLRRCAISAIARGPQAGVGGCDNNSVISQGLLQINKVNRQAFLAGTCLDLTAKEYDLLLHFAENPQVVFRRSELLDKIWGYHHQGYEHTVNSHINRLRGKLEKDPSHPEYIHTVWGVGYRFAAPDATESSRVC